MPTNKNEQIINESPFKFIDIHLKREMSCCKLFQNFYSCFRLANTCKELSTRGQTWLEGLIERMV